MSRKWLLVAALFLSLIASIWSIKNPADGTVPAVTKKNKSVNVAAMGYTESSAGERGRSRESFEQVLTLQNRHIDDEGIDLFQVPPPPVVVKMPPPAPVVAPPPPPPPPIAPAIPWRFAGRFVEQNQTMVLLTSATKDITIKKGDTIDNVYRVEDIKETEIIFTYLPLNEAQRIVITGGR